MLRVVQMSTACVCTPDLMKHASLTLAVVLCPVPGDSYTNSKTKIYTHKYKHTNAKINTEIQFSYALLSFGHLLEGDLQRENFSDTAAILLCNLHFELLQICSDDSGVRMTVGKM